MDELYLLRISIMRLKLSRADFIYIKEVKTYNGYGKVHDLARIFRLRDFKWVVMGFLGTILGFYHSKFQFFPG